jgi:hypothetical protein
VLLLYCLFYCLRVYVHWRRVPSLILETIGYSIRVGTVLQQHLSVHYGAVILAFFENEENTEPEMVAKIGLSDTSVEGVFPFLDDFRRI